MARFLKKGGRFMGLSDLKVDREGAITIATLNRPDKLNALNKDLFDELEELVDILETEKNTRVLIITGSGEKAFCVGADLKERLGMNEKDILARMDYVRRLYQKLEALPMPVIAALNGSALGGGLELALTCDLRVAADTAMLGFPEVDLAIIPGNGGTQRFARVVGLAKALELVLLAKRITADQAKVVGLLHEVVKPTEVMPVAMKWADKLLEAGPIALKQAKLAIRKGLEGSLESGLKVEIEAYKGVLYSKDRVEGLKAFQEKRKPVYQGI